MRYKILEYVDREILEHDVTRHMRDGWEPVGGVVIKPGTSLSDPRYVQALKTDRWEPPKNG